MTKPVHFRPTPITVGVRSALPNRNEIAGYTAADLCELPTPPSSESWDDLLAFYETCSKGVIEVGTQIRDLLRVPGVLNGILHKREFEVRIVNLKNDLEEFANKLVLIKEQHAARHGLVKDENELALCFSLYEDYVEWSGLFSGVVETNLTGISQELNPLIRIEKSLSEGVV